MTDKHNGKWREVKLKDVCREITVGHVGPMADQYCDTGIPFLRSQNVRPFRFVPLGLCFVSTAFHAKLKKSALFPGDVVVTRTGANTGQCCAIPHSLPVANCADLVIFRPSDRIDAQFLMYLLNSGWGRATISGGVVGAAQHHFNIGVAKEVLVRIPSVPAQRKITGVLSAYDDLIENNSRRIVILEEMAQTIYREWFVQFRFPGHENVKLIDSPLGKIPEGWKVEPLSAVADVNVLSIKKGHEPEELNYVDIASVSTGQIDEIRLLRFSDAPGRARRIVRHGDVIWSTVRPNRKSYSLILRPLPNMIASTGFAVISGTKAPYTFLYHTLTTDDFVGYLVNHATGSAYPAVNSGDFEKATILCPAQDVLTAFHDITEPMFLAQHCMVQKNKKLRATRDLLLPKLLNGQLDVEELDIETGAPLVEAEA